MWLLWLGTTSQDKLSIIEDVYKNSFCISFLLTPSPPVMVKDHFLHFFYFWQSKTYINFDLKFLHIHSKSEEKSLFKHRHVGCLSRGFGVARSVVKSVFLFEVPVQRKSPKTTQMVTFPRKGYFGWFLAFCSLLGFQIKKRISLCF